MGLISRTLMLRIVMFSTALLVIPAPAAEAGASCNQVSDVPAARVRWAVARRSSVEAARHEESCRAYGNQFFEAVMARQAVSICEDSIDRQRTLDVLDAEIDAFNNLIASQCDGSRH